MANALLDRAWAVPSSEVDGTEKAVLVNLCDRANAAGDNLRMSVSAIAAETALHRVTVQHALTRLTRKGFIEPKGTGRRGIVHYAIVTAALRWERWIRPVADGNTCSAGQQVVVADDNRNVLPTTTQTVSEPLSEPTERARAVVASPLTGARRRGHRRHVLCMERICLTEYQADQLARHAGGDYDEARDEVLRWASETGERLVSGDWRGMQLDEDELKFWDRAWTAQGVHAVTARRRTPGTSTSDPEVEQTDLRRAV